MKECKGICQQCTDDPSNTIFDPAVVSSGRSPGQNRFMNKSCTVCEYWILTTQTHCCCCHNLYRIRVHGVKEFMTMDYYIERSQPTKRRPIEISLFNPPVEI